jgi:hypothetical protein
LLPTTERSPADTLLALVAWAPRRGLTCLAESGRDSALLAVAAYALLP